MLPHPHAPHGEIHGWRDFITHIAVVAIGLLLAIGLEQSVEFIHHRYERNELEAQMHDTLEANLRRTEKNLKVLNDFRSYLMELRTAVNAKIAGTAATPPAVTDPRNFEYAPPPNLGSYEASKLNGSVSLLDLDRIRVYDRIEFQHSLMLTNFQVFFESIEKLSAFVSRFETGEIKSSFAMPQVNMAELSPVELTEYRMLVANAVTYTQAYALQMRNLGVSYRLILNNEGNADAITDALAKAQDVNPPSTPNGAGSSK